MATIKDVANKAGLAVATVSRVMNNRGYISEETRSRVNEAIKELNYQPNELARSLNKQRNDTIGVIVPHIEHPYFAKLISFIEAGAVKLGHKIILCNSGSDTERELRYIDMCHSNRVAGIILCSASVSVEKLKELNIPIVTIERPENTVTSGIECDNYEGGRIAAEHLIERGCKRLLIYLGGAESEKIPIEPREAGFMDACKAHDVPFICLKHTDREYYALDYKDWVGSALQTNRDADGVFASNDIIAAIVLKTCAGMGIQVPDQIKVVGFDDTIISELATPSITSVRQPVKELAEMAVSFVDKSRDGEVVPIRTVLPVSLIKREST